MKEYLKYPLKIFANNTVLRLVIYSAWIRFSLLTIVFGVNYIDSSLFEQYESYYTLAKGLFNTFFVILVLGYFISKHRFCVVSIMSFYGIVFVRGNWFLNEWFPYENYDNVTIYFIVAAWSIIIIDKLISLTKTALSKIKRK